MSERIVSPHEPVIVCPSCKIEIRLTESLAAPLLEATRQDYEQRLREHKQQIASREQALQVQQAALVAEKAGIEQEIAARLKAGRQQIAAEENERLRASLKDDFEAKARELAALKDLLQQREVKLAEAQQAQAEVLRRQRELDDAKRELDLTVEKRIHEGLGQIRTQARQEVEGELKLRLLEKEQTIAGMQKQIEALKQRSEQGSQQLQGEAQELALEDLLRQRFTCDEFLPVAKGEHGGDLLQLVRMLTGQSCGSVLWESKRTKHWSDAWLPKLREDQRTAKADLAVLVSQAMPAGIENFDLIDNVWVVHPRVVVPVATMLRQTLMEVAVARQALQGQQGKMELVYQYLTGPRFRQRIQAIVEAFTTMQSDLDRERKVITKQWAKRAEQIERVMQASVGMYGDLQGIAGQSLQELEGLELAALNADLE